MRPLPLLLVLAACTELPQTTGDESVLLAFDQGTLEQGEAPRALDAQAISTCSSPYWGSEARLDTHTLEAGVDTLDVARIGSSHLQFDLDLCPLSGSFPLPADADTSEGRLRWTPTADDVGDHIFFASNETDSCAGYTWWTTRHDITVVLTDDDDDDMSDVWETLHALDTDIDDGDDDPDDDGWTNLEEFSQGTDPNLSDLVETVELSWIEPLLFENNRVSLSSDRDPSVLWSFEIELYEDESMTALLYEVSSDQPTDIVLDTTLDADTSYWLRGGITVDGQTTWTELSEVQTGPTPACPDETADHCRDEWTSRRSRGFVVAGNASAWCSSGYSGRAADIVDATWNDLPLGDMNWIATHLEDAQSVYPNDDYDTERVVVRDDWFLPGRLEIFDEGLECGYGSGSSGSSCSDDPTSYVFHIHGSDLDGDGLWDAWQHHHALAEGDDAADDDPDGDGYTNLQEQTRGSDPNRHDDAPSPTVSFDAVGTTRWNRPWVVDADDTAQPFWHRHFEVFSDAAGTQLVDEWEGYGSRYAIGANVTAHTTYYVRVTVDDGVQVHTSDLTAANTGDLGPQLTRPSNTTMMDEGHSTISVTMSDPGDPGPHTYEWTVASQGESSSGYTMWPTPYRGVQTVTTSTPSATLEFLQTGRYRSYVKVQVKATDASGHSNTISWSQGVDNLPPDHPPASELSVPAPLGEWWGWVPQFTDPGRDHLTATLRSGPPGLTWDGKVASWFVPWHQMEPTTVSFLLDDQIDVTFVSATIEPVFTDNDDDGLPDAWEALHGLDPTRNDAQEDPDHDGLSHAEELQHQTDPTTSEWLQLDFHVPDRMDDDNIHVLIDHEFALAASLAGWVQVYLDPDGRYPIFSNVPWSFQATPERAHTEIPLYWNDIDDAPRLPAHQQLYARVGVGGWDSAPVWSDIKPFEVTTTPANDRVRPRYPLADATVPTGSLTLAWQARFDQEGEEMDYRVGLKSESQDELFAVTLGPDDVRRDGHHRAYTVDPAMDLPEGRYHWTIEAGPERRFRDQGVETRFDIKEHAQLPPVPDLSDPSDLADTASTVSAWPEAVSLTFPESDGGSRLVYIRLEPDNPNEQVRSHKFTASSSDEMIMWHLSDEAPLPAGKWTVYVQVINPWQQTSDHRTFRRSVRHGIWSCQTQPGTGSTAPLLLAILGLLRRRRPRDQHSEGRRAP